MQKASASDNAEGERIHAAITARPYSPIYLRLSIPASQFADFKKSLSNNDSVPCHPFSPSHLSVRVDAGKTNVASHNFTQLNNASTRDIL